MTVFNGFLQAVAGADVSPGEPVSETGSSGG